MATMPHADSSDRVPGAIDAEVVEEFDPVPVPADESELATVIAPVRALVPPSPVVLPAVQAAAAAATGFVAGAATLALVRRRSARKLARVRAARRTPEGLSIVGTRSFLVDVHLIARGSQEQ